MLRNNTVAYIRAGKVKVHDLNFMWIIQDWSKIIQSLCLLQGDSMSVSATVSGNYF